MTTDDTLVKHAVQPLSLPTQKEFLVMELYPIIN